MGIQEALNKTVEDNRKLEQEIERLNNVINELENWLMSSLTNEEFCYLAENYKDRCRYDVYNEVLDKLKKLKESEK